jgi:diphthine-ammonia ligase
MFLLFLIVCSYYLIMCGIIGAINFVEAETIVKNGLKILSNRGKDASKVTKIYKNSFFGHNLHSIIDFVEQPLKSSKGFLVSNNEIYNWKELNEKYKLNAKNDSELILKLIEKIGVEKISSIVNELDGVFAFAYYSKAKEKIVLARDLFGVKPLVYQHNEKEKSLLFASEKKAFSFESQHLNPRKILSFNVKTGSVSFKERKIKKAVLKKPKDELEKAFLKAVSKRIPEKKFGLLLSGGIDSSVIGQALMANKKQFTSYFAGIKDFAKPKDLDFATRVAHDLNSNIKINLVSVEEFEKELPRIVALIESADPVRIGIASTIYFATKIAKEKVLFSGLGADELFAGYNRFKESNDINKDVYSYLLKMYENDLYFEDIVCMKNKVELRLPFLDKKLAEIALAIPPKMKIDPKNGLNKKILRELAIGFGLDEEFAWRPKKAAQYGSNFDKALGVLAKKNGFKSKADYLASLQKKHSPIVQKNIPIAALVSTGKDSLYAAYLMQKQGYEIKCFLTIDSKNKDSFMFHTPTISLAKLQAEAFGVPVFIVKTKGEKEKELKDLELLILKAKARFSIEGIVSGALFSNYQRERIEKISEKIGIRSFTPLWQMNQTTYMKRLLKERFKVMVTKIACYGLTKKWLGKIITSKDLLELEKLKKKYGVNVAGEGGEYETLVIDAPFFSKKIEVSLSKKLENEFTGYVEIKNAKLAKKAKLTKK